MKLNPAQEKVASTLSGPILVLAGAGAGKTKTITERISRLIKNGVNPSQILAITFTNKAAREMRERVEKTIERDRTLNTPVSMFERPFVSTFHALGVHIIKENCRILEIPRHFAIFDRGDSISAVKDALRNAGLDPKEWEPGKILSAISREKGNGVSLFDYRERELSGGGNTILLNVWEGYERALRAEKALDFDDLLLTTMRLLRDRKEVREHYEKVWTHIHIDEYQDTNRVQYETAKLLSSKNQNICVVGDIDQSIYSWRGADFKNIMRFEKDFPETSVVLLEENYRSTKTILKAANAVIEKNTLRKDKTLFTQNQEGEKITLYGAYDETDEARFIAEKAQILIEEGVEAKEISVLYRANFQSRVLEEAFLDRRIPYQVLGTRFFERKEVKDILSYLRASLNPESTADLKRIINAPARGIGKVTLLKIFSGKENELPDGVRQKVAGFRKLLEKIAETSKIKKPSETIEYIIVETGMKRVFEEGTDEDRDRLENIFELMALAQKYDGLTPEEGIEKLLTDAALAEDQDNLREDKGGVRLMTVHAAKGLEFDYVFITGLEADLFPHRGMSEGKDSVEKKEEERRLFYVALTRARKKLFLSYASVRTVFGSRGVNMPSEFLEDIDETLLDPTEEDRSSRGKVIYLD